MTELDRHFETFGRRLHAARPPAPRRGLALGGTGVLATAAVAATLLIGGGTAPVDAIAAARAALTAQPDQLVAMRLRVELPGTTATVEQWTATNPRRWRSVRVIDGTRMEAAYGDGAQSWLGESGTLQIQRGAGEDENFASLPIPLGFGSSNAETDIRGLLAAGRLTDQGEVEAGGRTVRRLVGGGMTYDVDPVTFAPLQGSLTEPPLRFTVERYEKLPLTDETAKLLEITPPAGTKVVAGTAEELRDRPPTADPRP